MMLPTHDLIRHRLVDAIRRAYGLDDGVMPTLVVEYPPTRAMGDLAFPVAFELARRLRKAPRVIATEIVAAMEATPGIQRAEAAPNGYINVFLSRDSLLRALLGARGSEAGHESKRQGKVVVEHTAINPNKAAHVGHLRNAALGDTLGRLLRFLGHDVEIQNYIDDTGVQVADVVVGFRHLEHRTIDEVRQLAISTRFDYHCWDLYAQVTEWYEGDSERLRLRTDTLHAIEQGGNEQAALGAIIADEIVRRHLATMRRLDVDYDLLTWEGDILRLKFWDRAFEILTQQGAVFRQTKGRLAGCWVMAIDDSTESASPADPTSDPDEPDDDHEPREKVIVRSDGTVTYVGKDLANQFWKFGLLGADFHYRVFATRDDGSPIWATSTERLVDGPSGQPPAFGGATAVYNVIDARQSYLQKLLRQALMALGHVAEAERSIHFAYEMVALSPATARELGYQEADDARPFVEVSGRKGLGVKADDLLDRLEEKAGREVAARNPDASAEQVRDTAVIIATAALRYFMIKYSRGKVIAFDLDEALSFEGESGPYVQYAVVRASNILAKLEARDGLSAGMVVAALATTPPAPLTHDEGRDDLWNLVLEAGRLDEIVEQSVRTLELSVLAKYAFGLAQSFNAFYHRFPILKEPDPDARIWRAAVVAVVRQQLTRTLELMGCAVPTRM